MDNHPKRHFRTLVASAIFAAVLGLGSGPASALVIDFDPAPFTGTTDSFTSDGFTFTFTDAGDGGGGEGFAISASDGEDSTSGIDALSFSEDTDTIEIITIVLTAGGTFTFDSIYIDSLGPDMFLEGRSGGTTLYSTTVGAGTGTEPSGNSAQLVDTVRLRSTDFFQLIFDNFTVNSSISVPEPGTLALFVTGLIGLGLLSRRRRQPMA